MRVKWYPFESEIHLDEENRRVVEEQISRLMPKDLESIVKKA